MYIMATEHPLCCCLYLLSFEASPFFLARARRKPPAHFSENKHESSRPATPQSPLFCILLFLAPGAVLFGLARWRSIRCRPQAIVDQWQKSALPHEKSRLGAVLFVSTARARHTSGSAAVQTNQHRPTSAQQQHHTKAKTAKRVCRFCGDCPCFVVRAFFPVRSRARAVSKHRRRDNRRPHKKSDAVPRQKKRRDTHSRSFFVTEPARLIPPDTTEAKKGTRPQEKRSERSE